MITQDMIIAGIIGGVVAGIVLRTSELISNSVRKKEFSLKAWTVELIVMIILLVIALLVAIKMYPQ